MLRHASKASHVAGDERWRARDQVFATLSDWERRWRDRQPYLQSRGYMLRSRYHPEWIPSWRLTKQKFRDCEDAIEAPLREHLIDARRVSDDTPVYIKRVQTGDNESWIATLLCSEAIRRDPSNHCVPILDLFQDDEDPGTSYMIMPFLRLIDRPAMNAVEEVCDFVDQILEGLVFMHGQGVAHSDCTYKNIMMDASAMYPRGVHPVHDLFLPDAVTPARPLPRTSVPVRYYFVDYGLSVHVPPDGRSGLVLGTLGRDQDVPELSDEVPYDPFKVDVFIIGNLLRRMFYDQYSNVNFLLPLFESMVEIDPVRRPNAEEARKQWLAIRPGLLTIHRRWRLRPRQEPWPETFIYEIASLYCVSRFTLPTVALIVLVCCYMVT
ncbi:kinase-like domain-containing protein [Fomitopsis serialis]|uniref:kinase-like domain-containing protein n=1 Tax=Fomitopsis serialis TaxID=139415 RepID=UPI0020088638|nr:kinase-like domain-containing protein [Neoantrodia serialis]KAH9918118.1 kinase-like domain-containing protein [Neoantrodia serialis]